MCHSVFHSGEKIESIEFDKRKGHPLDNAKEGRLLLSRAKIFIRGEMQNTKPTLMQVHIVRDASPHDSRAHLRQGNRTSLGDEHINALIKKRDGGANGRVPRKGDFTVGEEDVDLAGAVDIMIGYVVDKDRLGEVELAGDGLLLLLGWRCGEVGWDSHYGERVAFVAGGGEDIEGDEWDFHDGLVISDKNLEDIDTRETLGCSEAESRCS